MRRALSGVHFRRSLFRLRRRLNDKLRLDGATSTGMRGLHGRPWANLIGRGSNGLSLGKSDMRRFKVWAETSRGTNTVSRSYSRRTRAKLATGLKQATLSSTA